MMSMLICRRKQMCRRVVYERRTMHLPWR